MLTRSGAPLEDVTRTLEQKKKSRWSPRIIESRDELADLRVDDESLEQEEHNAALLRFRRAMLLGLFLWPAFGAMDWVAAHYLAPESFPLLLKLRGFGAVIIAVFWYAMKRGAYFSPRALRLVDTTLYATASVLLSLMCLSLGGIASPYANGIMIILAARITTVAERWQRSLTSVAMPVVVHLAVLLGAGVIDPKVRDQFQDPEMLGTFFIHTSAIIGSAVALAAAGHSLWSMRRKIFAARNIGRYRLTEKIGSGGMGEVWSAHHHGLKREVAVKILRPNRARSPRAVARFEREVRATTNLTHPNTIRVFDYGVTDDGLWFYTMELLKGMDMAQLVRRTGPVPPVRALHLIIQATKALAEAHAAGIVHRDVKPENLFISTVGGEPDFVKVLDFGVARSMEPEDDLILTADGAVTGTPRYMAPEVASGKGADARADVYGLGAVLYFLLSGQHAYDQATAAGIILAQAKPLPLPSERLGSALPADLEAVVMRCLQHDAHDRFAHAGEVVVALAACSDHGRWQPPVAMAH